ncbi:bifunctional methylenetetrahydrofolate dehydrogenase/methenyltetrahydrofolate cyclohydrolase FolD [Deinococcus multiflagellatus]|uniref:bifunctional methylenetetrahydrofolate dehydrogenase/methenyltetrahydrofolate cyclohydrolase FolD n=1 Tax=Deinococcus multiflagellatus TaxID=1656887 RepID=UPI001CCAD077|nr:bifunctional methylenetetrahydrofolate dehydrogenase/methenyltetrahydrofolate cyclohydrolase FolD [Deinococcus multiflagellatus]MBZ9712908.1 bifunctional methylenetetrahydrofolate dehydrogenase/methenyltetrahydrofolate cyclohydrolase FolD [Deinococcus multiflagellatus]
MTAGPARPLPGAPAAQALLAEAARRAAALGTPPGLALVRVGDDPASVAYVRGKARKAAEVGLRSTVHALPEATPQAELLALIAQLNADPAVHGVLVQLPLPVHLDPQPVLDAVLPAKDVDGLHPVSTGHLWAGQPGLRPCTPAGVMALLAFYGLPVAGQRAVIVGRSALVGRPLAALLLNANATVTLAHSRTPDLGAVTREADLLIVAAGRAHLITPDMVRPGATVIDVGINRVPDETGQGRLTGDVHPGVAGVAGALTPVPGGVGPMTVAQLLMNTVLAAEAQQAQSPQPQTPEVSGGLLR